MHLKFQSRPQEGRQAHLVEHVSDLLKVGLLEAAAGHGGGADAHATRRERADVAHHRILVQCDVHQVARLLHLVAIDALHGEENSGLWDIYIKATTQILRGKVSCNTARSDNMHKATAAHPSHALSALGAQVWPDQKQRQLRLIYGCGGWSQRNVHAECQAVCGTTQAEAPITSGRRSHRTRWLSVPPVTNL